MLLLLPRGKWSNCHQGAASTTATPPKTKSSMSPRGSSSSGKKRALDNEDLLDALAAELDLDDDDSDSEFP